jgi:hypothetical protein
VQSTRVTRTRRLAIVVVAGCLALAACIAVVLHHYRHRAGASAQTSVAPQSPLSTPTVTVPPAPAANSSVHSCAVMPHSCGYPDASNSGVPQGTTLTAVPKELKSGPGWKWDSRGWISVNGNGAVVSGLAISGHIEVYASNVVISNDDINQPGAAWGVGLRSGSNVTIENSNIYSPSATGSGRLLVGIKDFGGATGVQILNNNIYHTSTGVQVDQGLIQGNYIHDLGYQAGDHLNGITSNSSEGQLIINHNTVFNSYSQTDAVSLFEDFGQQTNRVISNNLLAGGGYVIYGGQNAGGAAATNIKITDNRIATVYFPNGGSYGPLAAFGPTNPGNVWTGNFWDATGAAVSSG